MTQTTLSLAITSTTQPVLNVASTTGMTAVTTYLQMGNEFCRVVEVISATQARVLRGQLGSHSQQHGNGHAVYFGTADEFGGVGADYAPHYSDKLFFPRTSPATEVGTTTVTLTAGQILGGLILQDPSGGAVTDTLPTAALLVAAMPGCEVGSSFRFHIRNTADANETITMAAGSGGTYSGTTTIAQNNTKEFLVRITAIGSGAETYTVYSLGTVVH